MFTDYKNYDAMGLGELVNKGEVSPQELLAAAIARADQINPEINAIIHRFDERALALAETAMVGGNTGSAGAAGKCSLPAGPFKGVPFLLKDLLAAFAGEPITMGSRGIKFVPDYDSELVKRFKASGVNTFGKTNTPEFGLTITTEPKAHGATHNPHKLGYSSGGSSGGSAAAVAAGIVPMAAGGDGGGSIRFPASWCGVFGMKPSRGRNPMGPDTGEGWEGAVGEHVITRTVRDSALMLDQTAGHDIGAPYNIQLHEGSFFVASQEDPKPLRIALSRTPLVPNTDVDEEVMAALDATAKQLEALGHTVEEVEPEINPSTFWYDFFVVVCGHTASLSDFYEKTFGYEAVHQFEPSTKNMAMLGRSLSAGNFVNAKRGWHEAQMAMGRLLQDYDMMLCPTVPTPAVEHGVLTPSRLEELGMLASYRINIGKSLFDYGLVKTMAHPVLSKMAFTILGNVTGLPAMSVPLHQSKQGLPIGMQFYGRMCDEQTLFSLAGQLEREHLFIDTPSL